MESDYAGARTNTVYKVTAANETVAKQKYDQAREKLLQVNHWRDICGSQSAIFQLTDHQGRPQDEPARPGDYIRINQELLKIASIEAQCTPSGDCCYVAMRVMQDDDPAHSSTIIVQRTGNNLRAAIYAPNELPGQESNGIWLYLAAMLGLYKSHWKSLVKGLLRS